MEHFSGNAGYWLQQAMNAIFLAGVYATLATAYALLQGISNRIILSFGDIATVGAFAAVAVCLWGLISGRMGAAVLLPGLVAAAIVAGAAGHALHGLVFRPILAAPGQAVMIASIGLSIVLQELMRLQSGGRDLWLPPLFEGQVPVSGGAYPVSISATALAATAVSVLALLALRHVIRTTHAGRLWRAVAENPKLAALSGVNSDSVYRWSFVAASGFAGLAGATIAATYGGVSFIMGLVLGFKAMFAAIIGGFGTLRGAVAGGILLAFMEVAWVSLFPAAYRDAAIFGIIILLLVLKPEGLFGHVDQRRDAD